MKCFKKILFAFIIMLVVFTALIISVHFIPKSAIADNVVTSSKVLQEEGLYKKFLNFKLFQMDNFTDAYMLNIAASANADNPVEAAMMNYNFKSKKFLDLAYDTEKVAVDNYEGLEMESYGRYWHGYQVCVRPLLTFMTYPQIRVLNYVLFSLLLVLTTILLRRKISSVVAGIFLLSLLLINFPIVPYSMQFSTCFYISLVSMIAVLACPRLTSDLSNLLCTFFVIGGIVAYLDFLTTPQLTLGLPMIVYMLMKKPKKSWWVVIYLSAIWAVGYGLVWSSKWLIGYLLTGNNILADAMTSAELRSSNLYKGMEMTIPNIIAFIWKNIHAKGLVPVFYGGVVVLIAVIALYVKFAKNNVVIKQYSYLLLIAMIVPVWFLILRNHSIQHGWFTWRAILLSIFSFLLFVYYTIRKNTINKNNQ